MFSTKSAYLQLATVCVYFVITLIDVTNALFQVFIALLILSYTLGIEVRHLYKTWCRCSASATQSIEYFPILTQIDIELVLDHWESEMSLFSLILCRQTHNL